MSIASLKAGSIVICLVDRIFPLKAEVTIIAQEYTELDKTVVLRYPVKGQIRIQDARSFDIDKAEMFDHFLAGDVVRAHLISVGDMKSCFLSTVGPDFGVIRALDPAGNQLFPVDQSRMKNSNSEIFRRKVARPQWMQLDEPNN
jgi:exosome complex component CSL4